MQWRSSSTWRGIGGAPYIHSLNTITIQGADLDTKIAAASAAGFGAVELVQEDVDRYVEGGGTLDGLVGLLDRRQIAVANLLGLPAWLDADAHDRRRSAATVRRVVETAAHIGAPMVTCVPSGVRAEVARLRSDFGELVERAAKHDLVVGLEFLGWDPAVATIAQARDVVRDQLEGRGRIVVDVSHVATGGGGPEDLGAMSPSEIGIVHLNDAIVDGPGVIWDGDRVLPGDGNLPLAAMVRAVVDAGYVGAVSIELFDDRLWAADPFEVARISHARCLATWARAETLGVDTGDPAASPSS